MRNHVGVGVLVGLAALPALATATLAGPASAGY